MKKELEFYERQWVVNLKKWYLWVVMIAINVLFVYGFFQQVINGNPWGTNPMSNTGLIITMLLFFALTLIMLCSRLDTIINKEGVYIRYFPFHIRYKCFSWKEINKTEVKHYSPIKEFGGWGIRKRAGMTVYNVYGRSGLKLYFNDGRKIFIGTQKPDEISELLKEKDREY